MQNFRPIIHFFSLKFVVYRIFLYFCSRQFIVSIQAVKRYFHILLTVILLCSGCQYKLKPNEEEALQHPIQVQRYDRLQSRYLTTGDFSALQQMNTGYPMETRTLIEDILKLGEVNDPEINSKFLNFYQDTLLQTIIADAEAQYADMSDIDRQLS